MILKANSVADNKHEFASKFVHIKVNSEVGNILYVFKVAHNMSFCFLRDSLEFFFQ